VSRVFVTGGSGFIGRALIRRLRDRGDQVTAIVRDIVDEAFRRDPSHGFVSWYDETKFRGHEAAERRIARGDPRPDCHARDGVWTG
jgi:uncharacterized protein YbjT (DUF2867 family)